MAEVRRRPSGRDAYEVLAERIRSLERELDRVRRDADRRIAQLQQRVDDLESGS